MFLETECLILRKFEEKDFADFCEYAMDDEMSRMMGRQLLKTEADARENFDWLKDHEERGYALVYKETGRMIGNLTVEPVREHLAKLPELAGKQGVCISFSISRHYQRQGLMSEAVRAAVRELFEVERMDYVQCGYFSFNTASAKLQEKLGFRHLITMPKPHQAESENIIVVENVLWRDGESVCGETPNGR